MRKYRGLAKNGKWVYGWYVEAGWSYITPESHESGFHGGEVLTHELSGFIEVIPETVGQSTGRKDESGKEIYEGDIMQYLNFAKSKTEYSKNPYTTQVVRWDKSKCCYMGCWQGEVIGNIHQNPELLKNEDN